LLLAATARSFAHMPLRISDRNPTSINGQIRDSKRYSGSFVTGGGVLQLSKE